MRKLFLLSFVLFSTTCFSQAGSFDTSFSEDGRNRKCFPLSTASFTSAFQSTGKIVCYGNDYQGSGCLNRFNIDGSVDETFGNSGVIINILPTSGYYPQDMVIQSDNRIIIMGIIQNNIYPNAYWVARLLPDGALDPSFSGDGYLDLSFGTEQDRGTCVALQTDGKILVGGTSGSTAQYFTVARLLSNGNLDTTFGINGVVQTPFSGSESFANCIAVQQDGKIILGGYTVNAPFAKDFAMIRYDGNGTIDTGFGINGKVITTLNTTYSDYIDKIIIDPQGRIIASGCSSFEVNYKLAMVRYTSNGTLDTSFGTNGKVISNIGSWYSDVARQVDGKIVLVGGYYGDIFAVLRYLDNGALDNGFGANGLVTGGFEFGGFASSVLIQSDNKIVVTGNTPNPEFTLACSAIIRLNPGTLSTEEFTNSEVKLYPNPTSGVVFFDNSERMFEKVSVYNYLGQEVVKSFDCAHRDNVSFDLSNLSNGVYLLKFEGNGRNGVAKVVKE
ncbi:T9SS type A sorting domain-containing protein [Flavobacterium sp. RSB2_4_14]|uniref:T9SS type A sorting domain-containing protein n=1 Tax=Flavobacterium sp. RSB2_4_14 TaxID=3447665 RepID=UPI003F2E6C19